MKPIQLGRMRIHKVWEKDSPVPLLSQLPGTTSDDMQRLLGWYDQPDEVNPDPETSFMTFSVHSWVIELDGKTILIDTCCGNDKPREILPDVHMLSTDYLGNLRRAGFAPEDIDLVMCTHLHFDHVGWNTRLENGRWVPTFPNARYVFGRRDFEYFKTNPDGEELHNWAFVDSIVPVMEAGQGDVVEEDSVAHREIGNGVWLEPAFGHSPGCCTVNAQADGPPGRVLGRRDPPPGPADPPRPAVRLRHRRGDRLPGTQGDDGEARRHGRDVLPGALPPHFGRLREARRRCVSLRVD